MGEGNLHPTVVFDRGDEAAVARARSAFEEIMRLALQLGETTTGEHRVGVHKRPWLRSELDEVGYDVQRRSKATFDPRGVLYPGKVL